MPATDSMGNSNTQVIAEIPSPIAVTFQAFTDESTLKQWWGIAASIDARINGSAVAADGARGTVVELEQNRSIGIRWDTECVCPGSMLRFHFSESESGGTKIEILLEGLISDMMAEAEKELWVAATRRLQANLS